MSDAPTGSRWLHVLRDWVLPLVAVVLVFQLVGWLRAPSLPEQAPAFALPDLQGHEVSLEDLRGRTVVLNFWATWCGPCRLEIPSFNAFAAANPDIAVLGISHEPAAKLKRGARELGIEYPVLVADRETMARYGVTTFPTTVVVGPDGEVVTSHTGVMLRPQLWWATR